MAQFWLPATGTLASAALTTTLKSPGVLVCSVVTRTDFQSCGVAVLGLPTEAFPPSRYPCHSIPFKVETGKSGMFTYIGPTPLTTGIS